MYITMSSQNSSSEEIKEGKMSKAAQGIIISNYMWNYKQNLNLM